jgi:hypothetical protein
LLAFAGAHAPLAYGSLRGRFAAIFAGAHAPLAYGSLRGRFAALPAACRPPAHVTVATETAADLPDPFTRREAISDAVRGRPRRRIASEGPRRFTPHVAQRGRPALGQQAKRES